VGFAFAMLWSALATISGAEVPRCLAGLDRLFMVRAYPICRAFSIAHTARGNAPGLAEQIVLEMGSE
jgi:hypothetical protein